MCKSRFPKSVFSVFILFLLFSCSFSATIRVGGINSESISIKQAILRASPGDTILVQAGTYTENLRFQKSIYLKGEGRDKVILKPSDPASPTIMVENCADLVIEGFTIEAGNIAISLAMSNARILSNRIRTQNDGIRAGSFNHSIVLSDNILMGPFLQSKKSPLGSYGILLVGKGETLIQFNEIRGFGWGVYLTGKKPCKVEKNILSENVKGMFLGGDSVIELLSNHFKQNDIDGLLISGKVDCTMKSNLFNSNLQWDIRIALLECSTEMSQMFSGTLSGEANILDENYKLCPTEFPWGDNFFKKAE